MDTIPGFCSPNLLLPLACLSHSEESGQHLRNPLASCVQTLKPPFPPVQRKSSLAWQAVQPQCPSPPQSPPECPCCPSVGLVSQALRCWSDSLGSCLTACPWFSSASSYFSILSLSFLPLSALNPCLKAPSQSFLPSLHPSRAISSASVASVTIHKPMISKVPPGWLSPDLQAHRPVPAHVSCIYPLDCSASASSFSWIHGLSRTKSFRDQPLPSPGSCPCSGRAPAPTCQLPGGSLSTRAFCLRASAHTSPSA